VPPLVLAKLPTATQMPFSARLAVSASWIIVTLPVNCSDDRRPCGNPNQPRIVLVVNIVVSFQRVAAIERT
jgi:hypothetical protein